MCAVNVFKPVVNPHYAVNSLIKRNQWRLQFEAKRKPTLTVEYIWSYSSATYRFVSAEV